MFLQSSQRDFFGFPGNLSLFLLPPAEKDQDREDTELFHQSLGAELRSEKSLRSELGSRCQNIGGAITVTHLFLHRDTPQNAQTAQSFLSSKSCPSRRRYSPRSTCITAAPSRSSPIVLSNKTVCRRAASTRRSLIRLGPLLNQNSIPAMTAFAQLPTAGVKRGDGKMATNCSTSAARIFCSEFMSDSVHVGGCRTTEFLPPRLSRPPTGGPSSSYFLARTRAWRKKEAASSNRRSTGWGKSGKPRLWSFLHVCLPFPGAKSQQMKSKMNVQG